MNFFGLAKEVSYNIDSIRTFYLSEELFIDHL